MNKDKDAYVYDKLDRRIMAAIGKLVRKEEIEYFRQYLSINFRCTVLAKFKEPHSGDDTEVYKLECVQENQKDKCIEMHYIPFKSENDNLNAA